MKVMMETEARDGSSNNDNKIYGANRCSVVCSQFSSEDDLGDLHTGIHQKTGLQDARLLGVLELR